MDPTVMAAIIGAIALAVGALIGTVATILVETYFRPRSAENREKAENRRWTLQYYLPLKIKAIHRLDAIAVAQYMRYKSAAKFNIPELAVEAGIDQAKIPEIARQELEEFQKQTKPAALELAVARAAVFLDAESQKAADRFATSYWLHCVFSWKVIRDIEPESKLQQLLDRYPLRDTFSALRNELRRELNPNITLPLT